MGIIHHKNLLKIKHKLVVSCQAEGDSPFNSPEGVAMFAIAAQQGGAGGIRTEGLEKTKRIKELVDLPVIGLIKNKFPDGTVRITRTVQEVEALYKLGVDIIAIDGTLRTVEGYNGPELISYCKKIYPDICILADISTMEEAIACVKNCADGITTALRGYTLETHDQLNDPVDIRFIAELTRHFPGYPVIAEGKIKNLKQVKEITKSGVWSIIVGSVITRPHLITKDYVETMQQAL